MPEDRSQRLIFVVDDDPRNRKVLGWMLEDDGYRVRTIEDGKTALAQIDDEHPDLLLLDVMMPGLSGFEVCAAIKQNPATAATPVLLVTALRNTEDKVRGLDSGADDFLTKPVDRAELLARVRTHLRIKGLRDEVITAREELARQHRRLRALEQSRKDLTRMLVHDLKSPLTTLHLGLELLSNPSLPTGDATAQRRLQSMTTALGRIDTMVHNLLSTARLEESKPEPTLVVLPLGELVAEVCASVTGNEPGLEIQPELPACHGDAELLRRVVENLLSNADKYAGDEPVEVQVWATETTLELAVADRGPGVPADMRDKIFSKHVSGDSDPNRSQGLGLTFARMAVEAHGGAIWVEPRAGGGAVFRLTLPSAGRPEVAAAAQLVGATA